MRKLIYLFAFLFFGANFTSCTPDRIVSQTEEQACCDEDGDIPPPPTGGTGN